MRAFSLVELSIVLVILGLLTGGILAGQSLIRAAELRAVASEYQRYITAIQSFQDKYMALPGDMNNAQDFWGIAHASPSLCISTPSTDSKTCNGNADGRIYNSPSANEPFRLWQHLANAHLIEGQYDGISHGTLNLVTATPANSPKSRLGTGLWFAYWWGTLAGDSNRFAGTYNNYLQFGGELADADPDLAILTPAELWNIDTKFDDGKPAIGKVVARLWPTCTNATSSSDFNSSYTLESSSLGCLAVFRESY